MTVEALDPSFKRTRGSEGENTKWPRPGTVAVPQLCFPAVLHSTSTSIGVFQLAKRAAPWNIPGGVVN